MSINDNYKKAGRKRVLSDEERKQNNRDRSKRSIRFMPPDGFKEALKEYVDFAEDGNMNEFIFKLINNHKPFKDFRKSKNKV